VRTACALVGWTLLAGLLVATGGILCARFWTLGELLANLRFPLGLAAAGAGMLLALGRRRRAATGAALLALVLAWPAARLWLPARAADEPVGLESELRVATVNLLYGCVRPEALEAFADEFQPDVLGLLELLEENRSGTDWPAVLERWRERWPYQVVRTEGDSFGMALLSRLPLEDVRRLEPPGSANIYSDRPALLRATASVEGAPVDLFLVHAERPGRAWRRLARAALFEGIAEELRAAPAVVFGDLNCTEGSPLFRDLVEGAGLWDTRAGFGPCLSWRHERVPGRWVTLDHVLVRGLSVRGRGTGPRLGSDHLPAVAVLGVALPGR